jgi:hypothetical protein
MLRLLLLTSLLFLSLTQKLLVKKLKLELRNARKRELTTLNLNEVRIVRDKKAQPVRLINPSPKPVR